MRIVDEELGYDKFLADTSSAYLSLRSFVLVATEFPIDNPQDRDRIKSFVVAHSTDEKLLNQFISEQEIKLDTTKEIKTRRMNVIYKVMKPIAHSRHDMIKSKGKFEISMVYHHDEDLCETRLKFYVYDVEFRNGQTMFLIYDYLENEFKWVSADGCKII